MFEAEPADNILCEMRSVDSKKNLLPRHNSPWFETEMFHICFVFEPSILWIAGRSVLRIHQVRQLGTCFLAALTLAPQR